MYKLKKDLKKGELINLDLGEGVCEEVVGRWSPEKEESYWYVNDCGDVATDNWANHRMDEWLLSRGNCFQTEEEAIAHKEKLEFIAEFEEYWREHKWDGRDTIGGIYYDDDDLGEWRVADALFARNLFISEYRFNSINTAQGAIDKFGDKLKLLFK